MMVQWRTETCRPNSNKVYEDIYFVVLDGRGFTVAFDHSQLQTLSRTPLEEESAHRRDLYLTKHNTHKMQSDPNL